MDAIVLTASFDLQYGVLIDKLFLTQSHLTTKAERVINLHTYKVETKFQQNKD
jgi:hypothetical protein